MSLSKADYQFFLDLVRKKSAIVLDEGKQSMVESRLTPLLFQHNIPSPEALVLRLKAQPHGELHDLVLDVLATHETLFFRDGKPFELLRNKLLPELIEKRQIERKIRIWSGACSTGQEPYSVAMMIRQHFPSLNAWKVEILATDVSGYMIEKAANGYYTKAQLARGMPPDMLARFFEKADDLWRIKPDMRKSIEFRTMNLADKWDLKGKYDLILLRYVLIYFDMETRREILKKVLGCLSDDGYLLAGTAEGSIGSQPGLESVLVDKTLFYRVAAKPAFHTSLNPHSSKDKV